MIAAPQLSLELIVAVDAMALLDALVVVLAATRAALLTSNALQPPSRPHVSSRAFPAAARAVRMGLARQVDTAEFEEAIQDCSTPILLDVFATWCGPCQFMAPALEEVAQKLEGKVRVLKIDSDAEPDVSNTLQIRGLPTILLINDMSVIMRVEGALEANELLQLVDHYLFGGPPPQLGENLESVGPTQ